MKSHEVRPSSLLLDKLSVSQEYADYILNNCHGERSIGNGDALIEAMEDFYLWEEFLLSIGINEDDFE